MKTQYYTATSLDGFLATPDDSVDWLMTLGAGKPLFPRLVTTPPLQLQGVTRVGTHFAELRYAVGRGGATQRS